MNTNDYERQMEELRERVAVLQQANLDLINPPF